jgi:putative endonuclease
MHKNLKAMTFVYILYSKTANKYYIGSCEDLEIRLKQHSEKVFPGSFTSFYDDLELFYSMGELNYQQARKIEIHIKKMKSKKYLNDIAKYPDIINKLKDKYPK